MDVDALFVLILVTTRWERPSSDRHPARERRDFGSAGSGFVKRGGDGGTGGRGVQSRHRTPGNARMG